MHLGPTCSICQTWHQGQASCGRIEIGADKAPLVSVITIFLNANRFIREAIESVLAQDFTDFELILVDDGSTDGSSALACGYAEKFPDKISYLEHANHSNRGMSASRNLRHPTRPRCVHFLL